MRASISSARVAIAALASALSASAAFAAPVSRSLEDQYGRAVELRVGAGKPVVVIASSAREAADEIQAWDRALAGIQPATELFRIADLKALPFFVPRGAVTKDLKDKHPDLIILLDWKGEASSALGAPKKGTAVLAFGRDGVELGRVEGAASASGAARIQALLQGAR